MVFITTTWGHKDFREGVEVWHLIRNLKVTFSVLYFGSFQTCPHRENSIMNPHVLSFKDRQHSVLVLCISPMFFCTILRYFRGDRWHRKFVLHANVNIYILISYCWCKKLLQIQWHETTEIYSLIVLEVKSPKSTSLGEGQGVGRAGSFWNRFFAFSSV